MKIQYVRKEINLTNVTGESIESAIMGMFVSGQMKVGMSIPVKFGNNILLSFLIYSYNSKLGEKKRTIAFFIT